MKKDHRLYLAAAVYGAAIWIVIALATGRKEAWDADVYFSVGIPLVCVFSAVVAWLQPRRWWRWGVLPFAGQFAWMIVTQGPGNLLPLGMIAFAVLSIPAVIAARFGAFIAAKTRLEPSPPLEE